MAVTSVSKARQILLGMKRTISCYCCCRLFIPGVLAWKHSSSSQQLRWNDIFAYLLLRISRGSELTPNELKPTRAGEEGGARRAKLRAKGREERRSARRRHGRGRARQSVVSLPFPSFSTVGIYLYFWAKRSSSQSFPVHITLVLQFISIICLK